MAVYILYYLMSKEQLKLNDFEHSIPSDAFALDRAR